MHIGAKRALNYHLLKDIPGFLDCSCHHQRLKWKSVFLHSLPSRVQQKNEGN